MHTFFHNGRIITQDPSLPLADNMLVTFDRIAGLNTWAPPSSASVDLRGRTLVPGFIDAHIHIWKVGDLLTYMLDLRGVRSVAEMQEKLFDFAKKHPDRPWILARGFNEALFADGKMPDKADLDKVIPDRPCQVIRTCAHIAVLNSKALGICRINEETAAPSGGEIRRGADGKPNGILSETALGLAKAHIPDPDPEAYREMILAAQKALLQTGITSATDPAVAPDLLAVYRSMEARGELRIRINAVPIRVPDGADRALPVPEPFDSDFLTINTVKFFADGGISGKTAAVKAPYRNSTDRGVLRLSADFFEPLALESQEAGFRVATHAIGDEAIDAVLQVYQKLQKSNGRGLRHRIEHLGLPEPGHLELMRDLGAFCVSQPIFIKELGRNFRNYLPEQYLRRIYPYRSILDAGVSLAFSSDAPVVRDFSPLNGIQTAVDRTDAEGFVIAPEEAITGDEALKAYTSEAAAANADTRTGILAPGKKADFVLLGEGGTEVWVGGKKV